MKNWLPITVTLLLSSSITTCIPSAQAADSDVKFMEQIGGVPVAHQGDKTTLRFEDGTVVVVDKESIETTDTAGDVFLSLGNDYLSVSTMDSGLLEFDRLALVSEPLK
jgi:hypothetical protein